ncbi:hypothetical protein ACIQNT_38740 [Streptomyces luteogriseus]|uniref:hypothetical protein n=1 Tax=Streptomyces luteogriseus TaxID=68233 RepID=UPI0038296B9F
MSFPASTRRTLASIAALLVLLAGLLLAVSQLGDDSASGTNPQPTSSPSAPPSTGPADPSPSSPHTSEPPSTPEPTMPSDPTPTACNIFDPECAGTTGSLGDGA